MELQSESLQLEGLLAEFFVGQKTASAMADLRAHGVPAMEPIMDGNRVLMDDALNQRLGRVGEFDHPRFGRVREVALPFRRVGHEDAGPSSRHLSWASTRSRSCCGPAIPPTRSAFFEIATQFADDIGLIRSTGVPKSRIVFPMAGPGIPGVTGKWVTFWSAVNRKQALI